MNSTARIAVLREEFEKLGYRYETLVISGVDYTRFISPDGLLWMYKDSNGRLPMPYVSASLVLNDKVVAARYAGEKGVRVPRTVKVTDADYLVAEYRRLLGVSEGQALVVKPADATLSRGVSADVRTDEALRAALAGARKHSRSIVVQERIEGDEFRFVYVGTQLKAVIHKQKAQVVGDGRSSVRELIVEENSKRLAITGLRVRYPQLPLDIYEKKGIDLAAIPGAGHVIQLSDSTMLEEGASFYEVKDVVHQSYKDIADTLSRDFGGGYLAVDIIIRDYTQPAGSGNYAFLEFNDIPAPLFYYACRNQPDVPVMRDLVRYIDKVLHLAVDL